MPDFERLSEGYVAMPISPRLEEIAEQVRKGELPNSGRFCATCYTPVAADRRNCPYCDVELANGATVGAIPSDVIEIVRAKRHRESWIVHFFAFTGLFLGTAISIAMLVVLPGWWKLAAIAVLLFGTRGLAAVLGGWLGDMLAYRSARSLVQERWSERTASTTGESPLNR